MRLIDANKFYEDLVKEYPQVVNGFGSKINTFTDNVKEMLDEYEVVYDVDKVIEQLIFTSYMDDSDWWSDRVIYLDDAIDIVKKGGIVYTNHILSDRIKERYGDNNNYAYYKFNIDKMAENGYEIGVI